MEVFYPSYYNRFSCIASACPDSCCKEWEVDVDDVAAARYRSLPGALGDALRQVLKDTEDGTVMTIQDGRCPMWRQDGLCRIQAELGHEALCKTCREFPRLRHDYGAFVELGLELSCPEAARLILTQPLQWESEVAAGGETPDYDQEAMQILRRSREVAVRYLQESALPVNQKLAVLLLYAHHVQSWLDGGEEAELNETAFQETAMQHAKDGNWDLLLDFFLDLEILTEKWRKRLTTPVPVGEWDRRQTALAVYFVMRYWLQAVADYDLIGRVKFLVAANLLIHHLGGDLLETAQLFSKEIENDADNVEAILDGAYTNRALTDVNLLSLLVNG